MRKLASLLAFIGLLLIAPVAAAKEPQANVAHPALWVVKDDDTTIYLFGSVHVLKPGTVWFRGDIRKAFDSADTLMLEMVSPPQDEMAKIMAKVGIDPDGPPLSQKLDEAARAKYQQAMADIGMPWQALEPFQPWMAAVTLSVIPLQKLGYSSEAGVEKMLTTAAQAAGKPVEGLETAEQQLGFFASLPEEQQIAFLNDTVAELPKAESEFNALTAAWSKGEPDALAEEMNHSLEATPELAQALLYNRNASWAGWIANRMEQPGTVFIAVGAGHLAGRKSVIADLADRGFRIKRID